MDLEKRFKKFSCRYIIIKDHEIFSTWSINLAKLFSTWSNIIVIDSITGLHIFQD